VRSFLHLIAARTSSSLLLMLLALSACDRPGTQAGGAPPVTVAEPLSKSITEWDEYTGRFEAVQSVDVRARVSGYLTSIAFKDGQIVKAGDLLFVIDARPYQATLDQAKAALARAETQQQLASNDLDRVTKLLQSRAVSVEEYDTRLQQKKEARPPCGPRSLIYPSPRFIRPSPVARVRNVLTWEIWLQAATAVTPRS
jgi:multidrug efflux pump subunit AcrA (membrane-fusion protein)